MIHLTQLIKPSPVNSSPKSPSKEGGSATILRFVINLGVGNTGLLRCLI